MRKNSTALGLVLGLAGLVSTLAYVAQPAPAALPVPAALAAETDPVRDTEAEALVAARTLQQPVEVLAHRTEYRDVFAQPDGTLIANDHAQPVRVTQGDTWVPADATLKPGDDGTFSPAAALLGMRLSPGGDKPLMVVTRDQTSMTLTWPYGNLPPATAEGDHLTYPNVFPDVDLVANVTTEGFSHVLVVKTPEAAELPELQNLKLGVTGEGLDIQETETGGVVALDPATGNPVMEADAPTMWDSGSSSDETGAGVKADAEGPGDASEVADVDLKISGETLSLVPDAAMLDAEEDRFPLYIDPVWQTNTNSGWAMVDSGYPNEEYWKFDGKRHERIGLCPESCNSSKVKRLFYQMSTPYTGKTILSAEFRVTMQHAWNSTARAASLYMMPPTSKINSATNWNNQPGGADWSNNTFLETKSPTSTQGSCTSTNQNVGFNAKKALDRAVSEKLGSVILGLKATNESEYTHSKRFCDNGLLSVRYNRAPLIPNLNELTMSPGGQCVYGSTAAPYVDVPPVVKAILRDPDHSSAHTEQVKAEFKVTWTPPGGTLQTRSYTTGLKASGSQFTYQVPGDIPQNVLISWEVRASDNTSWGPWSTDGTRNPCQFLYDKTSPAAPDVDSAVYLPQDAADNGTTAAPACVESDEWLGSIGVPGDFVFDSAATDVVEYRYGFNTNPQPTNVLKPATAGGPVTFKNWYPDKEGPRTVNVQAVDKAGRSSSIASCTFRVGKRPPAAQWSLAEVAGELGAEDQIGDNDTTAGDGVTFGAQGPGGTSDTAAVFDGTAQGYLSTAARVLPDTSASFTVSGWFRVDDPSRHQTAVSQDGSGEPGFTLGVTGGSWIFELPMTDVNSLGMWQVRGAAATTGWTYVAASYDQVTRTMSLRVGDAAPLVAQRRSLTRSRGALQLGRRMDKGDYTAYWKGAMADVSVFDRLILDSEVTGLKKTAPTRLAYWRLNAETAKVSPEDRGGSGLTLGADATIYKHAALSLLGGGHLALTGTANSYATAPVNPDMANSFSVSARVKLSSSCTGKPMTVFSLKGAHSSPVVVRCNAEGSWELATTGADTAAPEFESRGGQERPRLIGKGDHLALVYNGYIRELTLYVNGESVDSIELVSPFVATGGVQIGRSFLGDGFKEFLSGAVDDVRVYNGVADPVLIQKISIQTREQLPL
ncbi:LamG-like jellyroll fold domain-containing protein [Actinoplanes sp. NPDC023714]|uniref:LamG-like jellyroll fold domain-containing protein n=1 Tax=Actinoplanes sp. NPDC023714 TaxID=3154322 RepID=UPI0033DCE482